jgi:hypothetical protein
MEKYSDNQLMYQINGKRYVSGICQPFAGLMSVLTPYPVKKQI